MPRVQARSAGRLPAGGNPTVRTGGRALEFEKQRQADAAKPAGPGRGNRGNAAKLRAQEETIEQLLAAVEALQAGDTIDPKTVAAWGVKPTVEPPLGRISDEAKAMLDQLDKQITHLAVIEDDAEWVKPRLAQLRAAHAELLAKAKSELPIDARVTRARERGQAQRGCARELGRRSRKSAKGARGSQ